MSVILDAAIRVFEQDGPESATTSRIAQVAGVSVGTLYQYFANRDSVLDALQDREFERAAAMMQRVLSSTSELSERQVARAVVENLLSLYRAAPALHRILAVEGLRVTPAERVQAFDARVVATIKAYLALSRARAACGNLDAAAFVVFQSVRATMLAYLIEAPAAVDDATLLDELTELVVRYLDRSSDCSPH